MGSSRTPTYRQQLDNYLSAASVAGGQPQRFGILTDGKYWILRWPGMGSVRYRRENAFTLANAEPMGTGCNWLRNRGAEERSVAPSEDNVREQILGEGPRFELTSPR